MSIEQQVLKIRKLSDDDLQESLRAVLGSSRTLIALLLAISARSRSAACT